MARRGPGEAPFHDDSEMATDNHTKFRGLCKTRTEVQILVPLRHLGVILAPLAAILKPVEVILRPSSDHLGYLGSYHEAILGHLGPS